MIKDKITFYNDYSDLNLLCFSCKMYGHVTKFCPSVHYTVEKIEFIRYYLSSELYFKNNFKRKSLKKISWKIKKNSI